MQIEHIHKPFLCINKLLIIFMKNLNQIEFKQQVNKSIEENFLYLFINKDLDNLSKLLFSEGKFCNLDKYDFLEYLETIFVNVNYHLTVYEKKYSGKLKVSEVVHCFKFSSFDSQNFEYESLYMNLLLVIKNNVIKSIITENELINNDEFEIRQFNN